MPAATLIDDKGEIRFAGARIQCRTGQTNGAESPDHAVRELGYVSLRERASSVQVFLRPSLVTEATLAALFYRLAEATPERVLISYLADEWRHELVRGAHQAMVRLEDLVSEAGMWQPRARYREEPQEIALGKHAALERWRPLLGVWGLTGGRVPGRITDLFAALGLGDEALLLRMPRNSERLIIEHYGLGISFYPLWCKLLLPGRDAEEQPDRDYAAMMTRAYRVAFGKRQPRFDAVDAVVRDPEGEMRRYRYDRLILPWEGDDGARFASGIWRLRSSYSPN